MKADNKAAYAAFVVFFLGTMLLLSLQTWAVMLVAGALHNAAPAIPALSYSASGWLVFLAYLLVFPATSSAKAATK